MKHLLVIATTIVLTSCGGKEYTEEAQQIESEKKLLDESYGNFNSIDSASAAQLTYQYSYVIKVFKKHFKVDTISPTLGKRMNAFKGLKSAKHYNSERARFKKEYAYTTSQLEDLKSNMQEGLIPEDSIKHYLTLELTASKDLRKQMDAYTVLINAQLVNYDTLSPYINGIVDSLLRANEPQ